MLQNDVHINADIIWQLIATNGALSVKQISKITGIKEMMVHFAIGWLSKENKIRFIFSGEDFEIEAQKDFREIYY